VLLLGVVAVLFAARSAPLGVPVADDFGFLSHALLHPPANWLDGGGSPLYWRPLSRQLYYMLLGPLMLGWPFAVALVHALLLALASILLYRALRPAWPAPAAALAASFPVVLDAARQVVTWSSCAQDLLALVFGAAALLALSRGRRLLALSSLLAALLSKETALAFAPALALWPAHARDGGELGAREPARRSDRLRTLAGSLAIVAAWWIVHEWVSRRAGLLPPPRGAGEGPGPSVPDQAWFALRGVWLDLWSVRDSSSLSASWVPWAALAVIGSGLAIGAGSVKGRAILRGALPWVGWGVLWAGIAMLPLARFMPLWSSHRSVIPAVGVGVALVALFRAAPPVWLAALAAIRLVALLTSPAPAPRISVTGSNVDFDFARIATLQRLSHEVHATLKKAHPTLPHGARIARNQWPRMSLFAFQEANAFHVWYRDTTLQVISMSDVKAHPERPLDAVIEFEPLQSPQLTLLEPAALRVVLFASDSLQRGRYAGAVAMLSDFEKLQPDTSCSIFMATMWSLRGGGLLSLRRDEEAAFALRRAIRFFAPDPNAHRFLAEYHRLKGQRTQAIAEFREHLRYFPNDVEVKRSLAAILSAGPGGTAAGP
jgi:Flp pilus assembly protein TadD